MNIFSQLRQILSTTRDRVLSTNKTAGNSQSMESRDFNGVQANAEQQQQ